MSRRIRLRDAGLLVLFVGSGCSALVYEVVWFQMLTLVLGASAVSLAILLTSFMAGLGLGSAGFARFVPRSRHPLKVYAALELALGGCGLLVPVLLPVAGRVYASLGSPGTSDLPLRAVAAVLVLVPPTILMGATLPAVARWLQRSPAEGLSIGLFYAANTFGAVLGCLLAGPYLLRLHDVHVASLVAAAVNLCVAAVAWGIASARDEAPASDGGTAPQEPTAAPAAHPAHATTNVDPAACLAIGLSGAAALGAETVWTRLLTLLLGPTVYAFSLVLAVFLLGLSLGSGLGTYLARRVRSASAAFAAAQLLQLAALPASAATIYHVLPAWMSREDAVASTAVRTPMDFCRVLAVVLVPTLLWGASFPLAVATATRRRGGTHGFPAAEAPSGSCDAAAVVGRVSAANTLGAMVGALAIGLIVVPHGGSDLAHRVLILASGLAGLVALHRACGSGECRAEQVAGTEPGSSGVRRGRDPFPSAAVAVSCAAALAVLLVPHVPRGLLAWGHTLARWNTAREYLYVAEGLDSTILVVDDENGRRCFHVCGKVEASNSSEDMRTQRMLGHLPAAAHGRPRKVLVVGCGSGMTAGSFLLHPSVEEVVLVEMESQVVTASRAHFAAENHRVLDDPRTRIVHDDARHFLAVTDETFDVIATDPIHPFVRGSAALYTQEFLELCRRHLAPGGTVTLWVPLYDSNAEAVRCELATFLRVFPHASVWSGEGRRAYDVVVVAKVDGPAPDGRDVAAALMRDEVVRRDFAEAGVPTADLLAGRCVARGEDLARWLAGAEINRDRNLRLQFLAGLTPDGREQHAILETLLREAALASVPARPPSSQATPPGESTTVELPAIEVLDGAPPRQQIEPPTVPSRPGAPRSGGLAN